MFPHLTCHATLGIQVVRGHDQVLRGLLEGVLQPGFSERSVTVECTIPLHLCQMRSEDRRQYHF